MVLYLFIACRQYGSIFVFGFHIFPGFCALLNRLIVKDKIRVKIKWTSDIVPDSQYQSLARVLSTFAFTIDSNQWLPSWFTMQDKYYMV